MKPGELKSWKSRVLVVLFLSSPDLVLAFLFFAGPRETDPLAASSGLPCLLASSWVPGIGEASGCGKSETRVFILSASSPTGEV